jgi:hypothetical protein
MSRNEFKFWFLFFILNSVLFLPGYLFNTDVSRFFPFQGLLHGSIYERCKTLFVRSNLDIFRISVDLFLLVFFYYFFRDRLNFRIYSWFTGLYYILILFFLLYYNAFEKLYRIPPMIYNDLYLLKLGFFNIGDQSLIKSTALLLILLVVLFGILWLVRRLFLLARGLQLGYWSKLIVMTFVLLLTINSLKSGFTFASNHVFQETFALVANNIRNSVDARNNLRDFNVDTINKQLNYNTFTLKTRPDIYLVFVESYGKLLFENDVLRKPFLRCLDSCSGMLAGNGWNMVSGFSVSPVSGGESWISYTSVLFGYNIKNQGTFNTLLRDSSVARYDNLFRILRKNGYKTFRLNAMPQNSNMEVPWDTYTKFYSIDKWINFPDLKYSGRLYGFGPSPPDQYSINFASEFMKDYSPGPRVLFFITQTTHHPFLSPDSVMMDWHSLNHVRDSIVFHAPLFLKKPKIENYLKAICYDLSALTRFIAGNEDTNAVFILIGDHQPPAIAGKKDGFETPVHIICRNRAFADGFRSYGFQWGLKPDVDSKPLHHEGIYSMFMHEFVKSYGTDNSTLPQYRPSGITAITP